MKKKIKIKIFLILLTVSLLAGVQLVWVFSVFFEMC